MGLPAGRGTPPFQTRPRPREAGVIAAANGFARDSRSPVSTTFGTTRLAAARSERSRGRRRSEPPGSNRRLRPGAQRFAKASPGSTVDKWPGGAASPTRTAAASVVPVDSARLSTKRPLRDSAGPPSGPGATHRPDEPRSKMPGCFELSREAGKTRAGFAPSLVGDRTDALPASRPRSCSSRPSPIPPGQWAGRPPLPPHVAPRNCRTLDRYGRNSFRGLRGSSSQPHRTPVPHDG